MTKTVSHVIAEETEKENSAYFWQLKNTYNERRTLFQERGYTINLRLKKKK